ncbi:LuxR C-terminal-related transcriptional regulator [Streptomyces phyllanthi]|uniref:Helix-turn-helix transcriptional regulator n=1 Tax=Streptomyces phyllanthi TaxID=1803180 RepID=A0A5N8W4R6_9ACTN|nr:helix-turn-helix transcriptional regulator [Streptomyces phyllanthi]MPY41886.1 helix-turn-helix transcriptional regulator [Streptomyces phyllanthi]
MTPEAHGHRADELCEEGLSLYARALREGGVPQEEAAGVPCVAGLGLLQPDMTNPRWLHPLPPAVVLPRVLGAIAEDIARQRRRETRLADMLQPLMEVHAQRVASADALSFTVVSGLANINTRIGQMMAKATDELLTVQPGGKRPPGVLNAVREQEQDLLSRGGRMRTLYQHTSRHDLGVLAHYEQLEGDVEVRTLDEVPHRMVILDRSMAFIPVMDDRSMALEVHNPAVLSCLAATFDLLWRLATPMYPQAVQPPTVNGITPRQRAIAALLVEGHTDTAIADRLGMNVRTARVHIAKLAATLGSESRAQLGYLIGRSGILKQEPQS